MLQVFFGDMPEATFNTSVFFKNTYQDCWFDDEFARAMIKGVDKATVVEGTLIDRSGRRTPTCVTPSAA